MATRHWAKEFFHRYDNDPARCPVCGLLYVKGLPDDDAMHRHFHHRVRSVFEPKSNARIAKLYATNGSFIPISVLSSESLRKHLENIGRAFKRELGYDFPPYEAQGDHGRSYMIADSTGRALGGFSVRWREYSNARPRWVLAWIWIVPSHRRHGYLRRVWEFLQPTYDYIEPEGPFSLGVATFFANREDVSDQVRKYAADTAAHLSKEA